MLSALDTGFQDGFLSFLDRDINKELLRFTTAGSVDDGKSTLIGRLLHDSKAVYEDQLASVKKSKINRSGGPIDFSLLTDGLRAEREQGITIDVAYRYFSTSRRKFIIADTPGHGRFDGGPRGDPRRRNQGLAPANPAPHAHRFVAGYSELASGDQQVGPGGLQGGRVSPPARGFSRSCRAARVSCRAMRSH